MRLIDADAAADKIMRGVEEHADEIGFGGTAIMIAFARAMRDETDFPTIDAAPVRHGRWIEKPPYEDETVKGLEFQIVCSECDEQNSSITFDENSVPIAKSFWRSRYCPNCGAKMAEPVNGGAQELG